HREGQRMSGSDRFDDAIDELINDRSPRSNAAGLGADEQEMLRMAQLLRGSRAESPDPQFVDRLHGRLAKPGRVSRRTAFVSGVAALAAGLAAGIGLSRSGNHPSTTTGNNQALVGSNGTWFRVASVAEVGDGAVLPFTAGAVQGVLINHAGQLRAMSRVCTHMGCTLRFQPAQQNLECPCHGATFALDGWQSGVNPYQRALPPLPALRVRVRGQAIEVLGA
ncbi:MAG: Rieske (2Fe-2S) protein, partial [Chloroflexota bacterium]